MEIPTEINGEFYVNMLMAGMDHLIWAALPGHRKGWAEDSFTWNFESPKHCLPLLSHIPFYTGIHWSKARFYNLYLQRIVLQRVQRESPKHYLKVRVTESGSQDINKEISHILFSVNSELCFALVLGPLKAAYKSRPPLYCFHCISHSSRLNSAVTWSWNRSDKETAIKLYPCEAGNYRIC